MRRQGTDLGDSCQGGQAGVDVQAGATDAQAGDAHASTADTRTVAAGAHSRAADVQAGAADAWGEFAVVDDMREPYQGIMRGPHEDTVVGIICVRLNYPKMPGNVVNASTYDFPVIYEVLDFEIERLFEGDAELEKLVIDAARRLEQSGVKVIIGACGYFAHFQRAVADSVDVPVFMSSLCQLPLIRMGCRQNAKIGVFCANGENLDDDILAMIGETSRDLIICDVSELKSFEAIRWGEGRLDNVRLSSDLAKLASDTLKENPGMEAILLECSDLPPYAHDIQRACGLAVYDFITMINWAAASVSRQRYL